MPKAYLREKKSYLDVMELTKRRHFATLSIRLTFNFSCYRKSLQSLIVQRKKPREVRKEIADGLNKSLNAP